MVLFILTKGPHDMKNAINYITRAATVEQNDGGLQAKHEFLANIVKHATAELKRTEKEAIAAKDAQRVVTSTYDRAPSRDLYIELHGVKAWTANSVKTNRSTLLWTEDSNDCFSSYK